VPIHPTRDRRIEAVDEARRWLTEWFDGYNDVDAASLRELCHYPLVSFGGGRLTWHNLAYAVREGPAEFDPTHRDPGWGFSLVDRWAVHHHTARKAHLLTDFTRLRADGTPYAVGLSRLAIVTKEGSEWAVRFLSSCGMRNPASVERDVDPEITAAVTDFVEDHVAAFARGDDEAVEAAYHYPFVNVDGPDLTVAESPAALDVTRPPADDRGDLLSMEVLPPQAGDKVVVDLTVERPTAGGDREREGAILLVTKQAGEWGVQVRSVTEGATGIS